MVTEKIIEQQIARLTASNNFADDLQAFSQAQPALMDYLSQEDTAAFTPSEQELLFFASLVIYHAITAHSGQPEEVKGEAISQAEEANFLCLQEQSAKAFRDRLTVFFTQSPEEDLLAFVEDLLLDEETDGVTKEGREPLFVVLKSTMDCLLPK